MKRLIFSSAFSLLVFNLAAQNCELKFVYKTKLNSVWSDYKEIVIKNSRDININQSFDSLVFEFQNSETCDSKVKIRSCFFENTPVVFEHNNEVKVGGNAGLFKVLIIGGGNSDWFNIFAKIGSKTSFKQVNETNFKAYPNPVNQILYLENETELTGIQIINELGQVVINESVPNNHYAVNCQELKPGIYFINIQSGNSNVTKRFIKQ